MPDSPKKTPILEATKIQARAVISIVKELEKELGKAWAHEIVGRAIGANYTAWRESRGFTPDAHPRTEGADGPDFRSSRKWWRTPKPHTATTSPAAPSPTISAALASRR